MFDVDRLAQDHYPYVGTNAASFLNDTRRPVVDRAGVQVEDTHECDYRRPECSRPRLRPPGARGFRIGALSRPSSTERPTAFLSYRQLQVENSFMPLDPASCVVYICENPSVVSAAAREIGSPCQPLLCTNGQPASAARLLLSQLHQAGAELRYH